MEMENGNAGLNIEEETWIQSSFKRDEPWYRRIKCKRRILFFIVICLLAVIGIVTAIVLVRKKSDDTTVGARVLGNMDMSVDPCDDFYTYACGAWKKKHDIPSYSVIGQVRNNVQLMLKHMLEDTASYPNVPGILKAKDMYASCIDLEKIEEKSYTAAISLLNELDGWPVLGSNPGGSWFPGKLSLSQLLISLRKYNSRPLIDIYVNPNEKDNENNIIYLDQPSFGLPGRLYYLQDSLSHMRQAYVTLASSVAKLFGADEGRAYREMRDVLELEINLANISVKMEDRRDNEALYNKMSISQLRRKFAEPGYTDPIQFDWLEYIRGVFDIENVKIPVNSREPVVVRAVPYFKKLFSVLQKHGKRTVTNYLIWYIVHNEVVDRLGSKFLEAKASYNEAVYGATAPSARWTACVYYTTNYFAAAVGHMFVKEIFNDSAKTAALDMIGNLKNAFEELLDELDWIDEPTKRLAREKVKAIRDRVGYSDYIKDADIINGLYEDDSIDKYEYFKNVLNNLKSDASGGLKYIRHKNDKDVWANIPSNVNAYYVPVKNAIGFPAGILQSPFYSENQPKSMNYGAIGVIMGHEITHGFDDTGRQYDKDGNLRQWWDGSIITKFKEKAQCMVDQYSQFVVPEANLSVNGINTQGENIADNGGLKQSFRAYRKWVEKRGSEEPMLPGLNFTNNQLFFINFAQIRCNNIREEGVIMSINNGVHSPRQFRVIGTLQNSRDFSAAFGCKKNSKMNPEKKCDVW